MSQKELNSIKIEWADPAYANEYLTFEILTPGYIDVYLGQTRYLGYSINNAKWDGKYAGGGTKTFSGHLLYANAGDVVRFKSSGGLEYYQILFTSSSTCSFNVYGNILSLAYADDFIGKSGEDSALYFCGLFAGTNVVSAKNLVLPSINPKHAYQYSSMFKNCSQLIHAPILPWTEIGSTNQDSQCGDMFNGCANLKYVKCLAEKNTIYKGHYGNTFQWMKDVSPTGLFVKHPNAIFETGENGIPEGWTVINATE